MRVCRDLRRLTVGRAATECVQWPPRRLRTRPRGHFAMTRAPGSAEGNGAVGAQFAFGDRKHQKKGRELLAKAVLKPAAEALGQIVHDLRAAAGLQAR